ncbi:Chymotrypsin inhibitor [Lucilia cuprina]|nr:Chymotrypsin inhibitor [Lucilia cuprina]
MAKFFNLFLVLAVVLVFAAAIQAQRCGPNQEFYPCGSACPPKCGESGMKACTMRCVVGCQCKQAEDCGENKEFNTCGSACPDRCGDSGMRACTMQCVVGCQCKRGYMLNSKDECVLPEDC